MSWIRRISGPGGCAAFGTPDPKRTSEVLEAIGNRLAKSQPELPLDADMQTSDGQIGTALRFDIEAALPTGALALIDVFDRSGAAVHGRDALFTDAAGHFIDAAEVRDRCCRAFIPHSVLKYEQSGPYTVRLRCVWYEQEYSKVHEFGRVRFPVTLPAPSGSWSRLEFARPLVWLGMEMARADHLVGQTEVRCVLRMLSRTMGFGPKDIIALRTVMVERPSVSIRGIIDLVMSRFGQMGPLDILGFLADVAWSDDILEERELELVRRAAHYLRVDSETWREIVRSRKPVKP